MSSGQAGASERRSRFHRLSITGVILLRAMPVYPRRLVPVRPLTRPAPAGENAGGGPPSPPMVRGAGISIKCLLMGSAYKHKRMNSPSPLAGEGPGVRGFRVERRNPSRTAHQDEPSPVLPLVDTLWYAGRLSFAGCQTASPIGHGVM